MGSPSEKLRFKLLRMYYAVPVTLGAGYNEEYFARKIRGETPQTSAPMPIEQAEKVLRVPRNYTKQDVERQFDLYFTANDPVKGGSIYLQCKFIAAKETLLESLTKK